MHKNALSLNAGKVEKSIFDLDPDQSDFVGIGKNAGTQQNKS